MTLDSARINWGKLASRILLYFVVSLICIVILYPYFVMFCTARKTVRKFSPPMAQSSPSMQCGPTLQIFGTGHLWGSTC